jgi:hypothetical protein
MSQLSFAEIVDAISGLSDEEKVSLSTWLNLQTMDAWDQEMHRDFSQGGRGHHLVSKIEAEIQSDIERQFPDRMITFESRASAEFWRCYHALPASIQQTADKQFALFQNDPAHRSLHLKPVGAFWSVRITEAYRALALRQGNIFYWFWIGAHDDYERLIG